MRATTSAASRLGVPPATRSATARAASSSRAGTSPRSGDAPITSVTSPFGGSEKRSASSAAVPRATSSNSFVSSRQTATGRSGSIAASDASVRASRRGDSNATVRVARAGELRPQPSAVTLGPGDEPDEPIPPATVAARHERGLDRRRPGKHGDAKTRIQGGADQTRARVADPGEPGVRDERDAPTGFQPRQGLADTPVLVVLVVAEQPWPHEAVTSQEDTRSTRVLAEDRLRRPELGEDPDRDVVEIADRSGADGERHAVYRLPSSASNATSPAPTMPASRPSSAATIRSRSPPVRALRGARAPPPGRATRAQPQRRSHRRSPRRRRERCS